MGKGWEVARTVLLFCEEAKPNREIIIAAGLKDRVTFMKKYIKPLIAEGLLAMSIPDKPNSRLQKYYTTEKGKSLIWSAGISKK